MRFQCYLFISDCFNTINIWQKLHEIKIVMKYTLIHFISLPISFFYLAMIIRIYLMCFIHK